jgi:hypothetical protein
MAKSPKILILEGLNYLAQQPNFFHQTGRKILPRVATLEDAVVGAD